METAKWQPFTFDYDVIAFHGPCNDGQAAAAIMWRKLPADYRQALAELGGMYAYAPGQKSLDLPDADSETNTGEVDTNPTNAGYAAQLREKGYPVVFVMTTPDYQLPANLIAGARVMYCDRWISRNINEIQRALELTKHITVVDHHSGNAQYVRPAMDLCEHTYGIDATPAKLSIIFNPALTESGASLTWRVFGAIGDEQTHMPPFITCVQIGDTWNWTQEPDLRVRELLAALRNRRLLDTFPAIVRCIEHWTPEFRDSLIAEGHQILRFTEQEVAQIARNASVGVVTTGSATYRVLYVNTPIHISEVGDKMRTMLAPESAGYCTKDGQYIHFTATWRQDSKTNAIYVSLRSPAPHIDLAAVARDVTGPGVKPGGGHRNAAGYTIDSVPLFG